jgi:O-antigen ligase
LYSFIWKFSPAAADSNVSVSLEQGSLGNQLVISGMFLAAVPLLLVHRQRAAALVVAGLPLFLTVGWFAATTLWSQHPDLTVRRIVAYAMVLVIAVGVIAAMSTPQRIVGTILAVFATVIVVDLFSVLLVPAVAVTVDGVQGVHSHKNDAGTVAMVTVLILGGSAWAVRKLALRLPLLLLCLAALAFLVVTRSKTTIALTFILLLLLPVLYLLLANSRALLAAVALLVCGVAAAGLMALALADVGINDVLSFVFGDPTLTRRTEIWQQLMISIHERPVRGFGWGAFWGTGDPLNPMHGPPRAWYLDASVVNTAHNGYVDIVLQSGLVGLGLALMLVARCIWNYARILSHKRTPAAARRFIAVFLAVALAILFNNSTESRLLGPADPIARLFDFIYLSGEWWRLQLLAGRERRVFPARPAGTMEPAAVAAGGPRL